MCRYAGAAHFCAARLCWRKEGQPTGCPSEIDDQPDNDPGACPVIRVDQLPKKFVPDRSAPPVMVMVRGLSNSMIGFFGSGVTCRQYVPAGNPPME